MTSSPSSHRARMVTPSAPKAPAVMATSSGSKAMPVRRRSDSATTRRRLLLAELVGEPVLVAWDGVALERVDQPGERQLLRVAEREVGDFRAEAVLLRQPAEDPVEDGGDAADHAVHASFLDGHPRCPPVCPLPSRSGHALDSADHATPGAALRRPRRFVHHRHVGRAGRPLARPAGRPPRLGLARGAAAHARRQPRASTARRAPTSSARELPRLWPLRPEFVTPARSVSTTSSRACPSMAIGGTWRRSSTRSWRASRRIAC